MADQEKRIRLNESGQPAHDRQVDKDPLARLMSMFERYKVFWLLAFGLGGWFGTKITQPLSAVPILQAETKAFQIEVRARLDTADTDRKAMTQVLKVFAKVICAGLTSVDRYKYDINCRELPAPEPVSINP